MQVMTGATFASLEKLVIAQNEERGTPCPRIHDSFTDAWRVFAAVTLLCGKEAEMEEIKVNTVTSPGAYHNGLEECMQELVAISTQGTNRTAAFKHKTLRPGCGGAVHGRSCKAAVLDGFEVSPSGKHGWIRKQPHARTCMGLVLLHGELIQSTLRGPLLLSQVSRKPVSVVAGIRRSSVRLRDVSPSSMPRQEVM